MIESYSETALAVCVSYLFGCKIGFPFQNNLRDLDLSCKTDLDLWDCFGREKAILYHNYTRLIYIFVVILDG